MTAPERDPGIIADLGSVRIRRRSPGDTLDEFYWRRDPVLARFNASAPYTGSYTAFLEELERQALYEGDTLGSYALEDCENRHIGTVIFFNVDQPAASAEFGITIGASSMLGRGIGTTVTIAFLRYLWATTPLRRIELHVLGWNERAIRCFRKAGFQDSARILRENGDELLRMDVRREWWLLWDMEGRFAAHGQVRGAGAEAG